MRIMLKNSIITHREIYMVMIFRNNTCYFVDTTPIIPQSVNTNTLYRRKKIHMLN
jgi:hypothetical protein